MASSSASKKSAAAIVPQAKPVYEKPWFEAAFLVGSLGIAALLHTIIAHPEFLSTQAVDAVAMAKMLAAGQFGDVFSRLTHPPVYPMLLAAMIKMEGVSDTPALMPAFQKINLALYALSIGLVYLFCRQNLKKPWTYVVTALYLLAPTTVFMAQSLDASMAYTTATLAAVLIIDRYFGKKLSVAGIPLPAPPPISNTELIVCGLFIGLSILTLQAGYTLLGAFAFVLLKKFGLKKSLSVMAVILLCLSPFIGRDLYHVIRQPGIYAAPSAELIETASSSKDKGFKLLKKHTEAVIQDSIKHTVGELNLGIVPQLLGPSKNTLWLEHLDFSKFAWLRWTLGILLLLGLSFGFARYSGIGSLYLLTYVVSAFVIFPGHNLTLAPVLPLLLVYSYLGMVRLDEWARKLHIPLMKVTGPALTGVILICTLSTHITAQFQRGISYPQLFTARQNLATASQTVKVEQDVAPDIIAGAAVAAEPETVQPENSADGRDKALKWLALNAEKDAKVATPRPKAAQKFTEKSQTPEMVRELRQYDYLVEEGVSMLNGRKNQNPGLKLVYTDPTAGIRIWRIRPENLPLAN